MATNLWSTVLNRSTDIPGCKCSTCAAHVCSVRSTRIFILNLFIFFYYHGITRVPVLCIPTVTVPVFIDEGTLVLFLKIIIILGSSRNYTVHYCTFMYCQIVVHRPVCILCVHIFILAVQTFYHFGIIVEDNCLVQMGCSVHLHC